MKYTQESKTHHLELTDDELRILIRALNFAWHNMEASYKDKAILTEVFAPLVKGNGLAQAFTSSEGQT